MKTKNRELVNRFKNISTMIVSGIVVSVVVAACSDDASSEFVSPFAESVSSIIVEVDYASGAEPYTGAGAQLDDPWAIFGDNAARLFGSSKTVTYPNALDEMQELTDVSGESFSTEEILAIADRHRDQADSDTTVTYYVLWLNGRFRDGDVQQNVIGVSLGTTRVIAMFKPVIRSIAVPGAGEVLERFSEQTTLVHEFGHAIGLVNNGVPLTSDHHDEENGAHCTNRDCVMFWSNEGVQDLVEFVQRFISSGSTILFGLECLDDTDAASGP